MIITVVGLYEMVATLTNAFDMPVQEARDTFALKEEERQGRRSNGVSL